mmetsp:Transcript_33286/g.81724  ORF Transcript_33286/g.81724 Transcript_33286/m.81724 type:complete len:212 (-) Transcript_33286:193-828(-)
MGGISEKPRAACCAYASAAACATQAGEGRVIVSCVNVQALLLDDLPSSTALHLPPACSTPKRGITLPSRGGAARATEIQQESVEQEQVPAQRRDVVLLVSPFLAQSASLGLLFRSRILATPLKITRERSRPVHACLLGHELLSIVLKGRQGLGVLSGAQVGKEAEHPRVGDDPCSSGPKQQAGRKLCVWPCRGFDQHGHAEHANATHYGSH